MVLLSPPLPLSLSSPALPQAARETAMETAAVPMTMRRVIAFILGVPP